MRTLHLSILLLSAAPYIRQTGLGQSTRVQNLRHYIFTGTYTYLNTFACNSSSFMLCHKSLQRTLDLNTEAFKCPRCETNFFPSKIQERSKTAGIQTIPESLHCSKTFSYPRLFPKRNVECNLYLVQFLEMKSFIICSV